MYAYIDETGHTGPNLFDKSQPIFMTGALITKVDFDVLYTSPIRRLAQQLNSDQIHASQLGISELEKIAFNLLKILKKADARFFLVRVEKAYLAATKLFDTLFDSAENLAVPWTLYNLKLLRLLLMFKVSSLLDEELAKQFWISIMNPVKEQAYEGFIEALRELNTRIDALPDQRSQQVVSDAITWAIENPEAIYLHTNSKLVRYGNLPNMVAFGDLLEGIDDQSKAWNRQVKTILHDRQSQIGTTLKYWHELFSNASPKPIKWPGERPYVFQKVAGSNFTLSAAADSVGIQVIDTVLWLFKRLDDKKPLSDGCAKLMDYLLKKTRVSDLSFQNVYSQLDADLNALMNTPLPEEQMEKGRELQRLVEERRQKEMSEYAEKKESQ